jgi:hypothetical protein
MQVLCTSYTCITSWRLIHVIRCYIAIRTTTKQNDTITQLNTIARRYSDMKTFIIYDYFYMLWKSKLVLGLGRKCQGTEKTSVVQLMFFSFHFCGGNWTITMICMHLCLPFYFKKKLRYLLLAFFFFPFTITFLLSKNCLAE